MTFCSLEQWMMWRKAILFGDYEIAEQIMKIDSSNKQAQTLIKKLGRQVRGFREKVWVAEREKNVEVGLYNKFKQNVSLRDQLLATDDSLLVEASPYDRIWGIGFNAVDAERVPQSEWGLNLLGKLLMKVRDRLRLEKPQASA